MLYIGVARRGSLLSAAQREDRPLRTLTTGAAALLIAAIVGVLALTGASAQEQAPPTPDDLKAARLAFIAEVDRADADVDLPEADRTNGRIVIMGVGGPDTLERALAWLDWQNARDANGQTTLPALEKARELKDILDDVQAKCVAAYGVCEWAMLAPIVSGPATVRVQVERLSASSWTVQIVEPGKGGAHGEPNSGPTVTVEPTTRARVLAETELTLSNGTKVRVVVDQKRDLRVEFAIVPDSNRDGRFTAADDVAFPDQRFAPANTRHNRPLSSSTVSIPDYRDTAWWLQVDGS